LIGARSAGAHQLLLRSPAMSVRRPASAVWIQMSPNRRRLRHRNWDARQRWAESSTNAQYQRGRCYPALLACKRWVDGLAWHERALGVVADRMRYAYDALGVSQATVYRVLAEQTAESD
jgi:hypothetical protein